MSKLNCMVQFGTNKETIIDSDLMSIEDAIKLFDQSKDQFKGELDLGNEPELALWIGCKDNNSYGETMHHWVASDFITVDGSLYMRA